MALPIPTATDDELQAKPVLREAAALIAALASHGGLRNPRQLELADAAAKSIGTILGNPTLVQCLVLRSLTEAGKPKEVLKRLKRSVGDLSASQRAEILTELEDLLLDYRLSGGELAAELASTLNVALPARSNQTGNPLKVLTEWRPIARRRDPALLAGARDFAVDFHETALVPVIRNAEATHDFAELKAAMSGVIRRVADEASNITLSIGIESQAAELAATADRLEKIAMQREAAIQRRAAMLKRHLRDDLEQLVTDAAEEFEVDMRRHAEKKGWFGKVDTADLNDRLAAKNLERRYQKLSWRYQEDLDLLDREVAEICDDFTKVSDEALRPMSRVEFRALAPSASRDLRMRAGIDQATTRTVVAGAAAAGGAAVAVQTGLIAVASIAPPVGAAVLGAVALAGVWKVYAQPDERNRQDQRQRARTLEESLRVSFQDHADRFQGVVDSIVERFSTAASAAIARPRIEGQRLREIADSHRTAASRIRSVATERINHLKLMLDAD